MSPKTKAKDEHKKNPQWNKKPQDNKAKQPPKPKHKTKQSRGKCWDNGVSGRNPQHLILRIAVSPGWLWPTRHHHWCQQLWSTLDFHTGFFLPSSPSFPGEADMKLGTFLWTLVVLQWSRRARLFLNSQCKHPESFNCLFKYFAGSDS